MKYMVKCPACRKRIFDISANSTAFIDIKCPHCRRVVEIKLKPQTA